MSRVKLTVKRLYKVDGERMVRTTATARVYVGEVLIATEVIEGLTESPVSKVLQHNEAPGNPARVEWECDGIAEMTVHEMQGCACCQHDES